MPRRRTTPIDTEPSNEQQDTHAFELNPERFLVRLTGSISRSCIMHAGKFLKRLGISVSQGMVLAELFSHDGASQENLRAVVKLDKGNITRALQVLEEHGFVLRCQDPEDRRIVRVYLTKKALTTRCELHTLAVHADNTLTKGFSEEEREILISLLLRMEANAQEMTWDWDNEGDSQYS